jgi:inosose dehydratase
MKTRRAFLNHLAAASLVPSLLAVSERMPPKTFPIASQTYNWHTFYRREGKEWGSDLDAHIAEYVQTGLTAIEPSLASVDFTRTLVPILKKHGLAMPSAYVNSVLHKKGEAEKSVNEVLAIAEAAKGSGVKIFVTNPTPIQWGVTTAVKSDAELMEQSKNVERLGAALRERGITLAYHTHDMEMLAGAREFHHVLQNTSPRHVAFCYDVHWIYRGAQNSQVAVFDILKMYGKRIVELHIRQSVGGIWCETFGSGDIDYQRFVKELVALKIRPHLVIEQCVEAKTPHTMDAVAAHKIDLAEVQKVFAPLIRS